MEVRWRSLFRSTSLGKRCTSYNALPTSRKRAADRWLLRNFLPRSSLFMIGKAQKSHGARSGLYGGCSNGVPPILLSASIATFQSRNADAPIRLLRHPKKGSFKTTVTPFSRSGWSVVKVHRVPREVLRKRDRHHNSTKFRLGVISPRTLCKRPSYLHTDSYIASKWLRLIGRDLEGSCRGIFWGTLSAFTGRTEKKYEKISV
jgi:hypothetical protein